MSEVTNAGGDAGRVKLYKNTAKADVSDSRRRRNENSIELRRQRRNDDMMKRRNLNIEFVEDENDTSASNIDSEMVNAAEKSTQLPQSLITIEEAIVILTNNPSVEDLRRAFMGIRRILSSARDPPINEIIKAGLLEALTKALEVDDERVQFEAAWALTNIVSGTSEQTVAAVQSGVTKPLIKLCHSSSSKVSEQVIWAVANIVGDSSELRDHMINKGLIAALAKLTRNLSLLSTSFIRIIAWTLSNLVRHKRPQVSFAVLLQVVPMIAALLKYKDAATQQDACWALSFMTDGADENIELALNHGVIPEMVAFLNSNQPELIPPALRVLGNFATGADKLTQVVVDSGILNEIIPDLLMCSTSSNVKECCWLISNIVAGTHDQIQAVFDVGLMSVVLEVLDKGESRSQFEAGWVVANIVHGGTSRQIIQLASIPGAIAVICHTLGVKNNDLVMNMLETLYGIMNAFTATDPAYVHTIEQLVEESGGLDKLESLQHHESERLYEMAYKIVDQFFNDDNEENNENDESTSKMDAGTNNDLTSKTMTFNF